MSDDDSYASEEEINIAVREMQVEMATYDRLALEAANQNADPSGNPDVQRGLLDWHSAVMFAHTRLRPYVIDKLRTDYWRVDIPDEKFTRLVDEEDGKAGLYLLDGYHTPVRVEAVQEQHRHTGNVVEKRVGADLLPVAVYREATQLLSECRARLGFGPTADDITPHSAPDHDDLHALLKIRGQDEAAERVPGGDD